LESESAAVVAAVFPNFPQNKRNFLRKNKLDIVRRVRFLTGRRACYEEFLVGQSPPLPYGSRGACGVSAYASADTAAGARPLVAGRWSLYAVVETIAGCGWCDPQQQRYDHAAPRYYPVS